MYREKVLAWAKIWHRAVVAARLVYIMLVTVAVASLPPSLAQVALVLVPLLQFMPLLSFNYF